MKATEEELRLKAGKLPRGRGPDIIGRSEDNSLCPLDVRAQTICTADAKLKFVGGSSGGSVARARLFESVDDEGRGGIVLSLTIEQPDGSTFIPHCRPLKQGVEIHLCGDEEAEALSVALMQVLAARRLRTRIVGAGIQIADIPRESDDIEAYWPGYWPR